jgi:antitoxin (DNA-binding transcriptional repressor) of toxin-antitoxin stability system
MPTVNMLEAKSSLSRLVNAVETGAETEIVIARNGRLAAKLVAVGRSAASQRLGIARGRFAVPDTIDEDEPRIAALFAGQAE